MNSGQGRISSAVIMTSLVFLLGFLIYWNINNYSTAKRELQDDLQVQMRLAEAQFTDSMMVSVFQVFVNDSMLPVSLDIIIEDSLNLRGANMTTTYDYSSTNKYSAIKELLKKEKSIHQDSLSAISFEIDSSFRTEIVVKEFSIDSGFHGHYNYSDVIYFPEGDTDTITENNVTIQYFDDAKAKILTSRKSAIIHENFLKNLKKSELPSSFSIVPIKKENVGKDNGIFVSVEHEKKRNYMFDQYVGFLFGQIYPSLIASIFLFGLIVLSFYLMRWNIDEQMRLASVKNEFVANMTHELKTPISTVGVALEALKNYGAINDPVKTAEYIDISQRELGRLQILIDKVLKMSALDKEIEVLQLEKVDMNKVIQGVMSSMKLHLEQNGVVANFNTTGEHWLVDGDPIHLTNVIYNLIDNGVKYGGDKPSLFIDLREHADKLSITIRDKGIGIAKEHQSKIFDRFYRIPANDIHNVKGHGLGLNYVLSVIKQLGGSISLNSKLMQGTEFVIQLPKSTS